MAGEKPTAIDEIIKKIKIPQNLGSFFEGDPTKITIQVHRDSGIELIEISRPFPFFTVYDLKLSIFNHFERRVSTAPEYQFLSINPLPKYFRPIDYFWQNPATLKEISLVSPIDTVNLKKQALQFVNESGEATSLGYSSRQRLLYETLIKVLPVKKEEYHLFFYEDLKKSYTEMTERIWNGFLHPYFPLLSYAETEPATAVLKKRLERYLRTQELTVRLNELLKEELLPISLGGLRFLQFQWLKAAEETLPPVESVFYSSPVTESRPYMRLIPTKGTSVTKLHLLRDKKPDLADPKLLKQWTRERNPTPENDFVMAKTVIRPIVAQQNPIYMTLRLYENGSADATIMPPKGVRKLDLTTDLENFNEYFKRGIDNLTLPKLVNLHTASLIYGIHLPPKSVSFTRNTMKRRLPIFSVFFQEISPLPGEQPLAMLRYKCVDNFLTEDRIFTYLTLLSTRQLVQGESLYSRLASDVADQFQIDLDEAIRYVAKWYQGKAEFQMVSSETKEYMEVNQSGIDIAIFAQHPFYTFHIHNVNSSQNLQRILTLISLLFSVSDEKLKVSEKAVAQVTAVIPVAAPPEEEEEEEEEVVGDLPEDSMFAQFAALGDEEEEDTVKELVEKDARAPAEDLGETRPLSLAPATREENEESIVTTDTAATGKETGLADFFLMKLKEADKRLFDYTKTHPSLKKYVSMCAANVTRQPAVVSREKFEEMRDITYKQDLASGRISFIVYPKEDKLPEKAGKRETFFFLKYATNEVKYNQNYYVCSKYFCIRDEKVLLEDDFKGTVLREPIEGRTTKVPDSCPFCEGKLVENRRNPGANETVIKRQVAPKTKDKYATYVGFLAKTPHPEGFYLPCCFLKPQTIYTTDKYYSVMKQKGIDLMPGKGLQPVKENGEEEEEDEEAAAAAPRTIAEKAISEMKPIKTKQLYMTAVKRVITKYIVGSEKLPLEIDEDEGPQIGLLPPILDQYFKQGIENFINPKTPHKLKPESEGFLRVGVENRVRFKGDSFLAAIAPYYNVENAKQMKDLIWQSLLNQPALFFQLNYGNFLIEFYDISEDRPTAAELQRWLEGTDTNRWDQAIQVPSSDEYGAMSRFQMSFMNFHAWLYSDTTMKEYRQFAGLLAQPNLLLRPSDGSSTDIPGITFIVINITEEGKVDIKCPPYGFNPDTIGNNDVAFLLHHYSGVWEPIFHVNVKSTLEPATFFFQKREKTSLWPAIVKQRVEEFMSESGCFTRGKHSYASRWVANPQRMIPASVLYKYFIGKKIGLEGILRDAYNHLVGLVFQLPGKPNALIPIPCVDDGYILPTTKIYLDWLDLQTAEASDILEFYDEYIVEPFKIYGDYTARQVWYRRASPQDPSKVWIRTILLKNNLLVPVNVDFLKNKPTVVDPRGFIWAKGSVEAKQKNTNEIEWEINKRIVFDLDTDEDESEGDDKINNSSTTEMTELFEHFRITFANWIAKKEDSSTFRTTLKGIIYEEIPLYERRKKLQVLLESQEILSWISTEETTGKASIQRVDCTEQGKELCNGRCVWSSTSEKCLLHAPEETQVGKTKVNTARLLMYRLIEELLRFSEKRREILENDMKYIATIDHVIVQGDQKIIPENTAAWYELLRGDWIQKTEEKPKYFEEFSRKQTIDLAPVTEETKLPVTLETYLNPDDPKVATYRILYAPLSSLLTRLSTFVETSATSLTEEQVQKLAVKVKYPVAQIDVRSDAVTAYASQGEKDEAFVLILTEKGPGLLVKDPMRDDLPTMAQLPEKLRELFAANPMKKLVPRIAVSKTRKNNKGQMQTQKVKPRIISRPASRTQDAEE